MEKISVIIITHNEERNIGSTLDAAWQVADEIIIMDSGSTDTTKEICIAKGARFFEQPWAGFGEQRNAAVLKAVHNYILVLDADEVMDEEMIRCIRQQKQDEFAQKIYSLHRRNFYFGKFMLHGMEGADIKPRLYHKRFARWNNKLVHEDLEYDVGIKTVKLKGYLLHYTYRSISEYMIKSDKYTSLGAQEYYLNGKDEPGFIKLVLGPAFTFVSAFILKAGFLDGWHGWILARLQAHAVLQKYAKLKMIYAEKRKQGS